LGEKKKKIAVLGGGYGGVECTRKLEEFFEGDENVEIVLISEDNFLLFTPMLPQVAAGMLATRDIVMPIRTIIKKTKFYEGRIKNIDPYGKIVNLWGTDEKRGLSIHYDFLVVSLGSETNFFGMSDVEKHAYTIKNLNDAMTIRNRVIDMLEHAENEPNPILKNSMLTFVIVGGGFAGIETAGEVMDLLLDARKYYPNIKKNEIKVLVLEALPNILPGFSEKLAKFAYNLLTKHGIEIKLKTAVTSFNGYEIKMKKIGENPESDKESEIEAVQTRTMIWTAGVTPVNTIKRSMFKTERGKIIVNDFLEVSDFPGVFAIGDCALFIDPITKKPFAPTAQLAEAQAKVAAYNLHSLIKHQDLKKFEYQSRGQMAIIGKRNGVASIFGMNISGIWAWILWRNVYLSKIPRWDKRLRVLLNWSIDLFFDRDISRLKFTDKKPQKEYKELDEVDDVW
jgi:NADH dehydrogenase